LLCQPLGSLSRSTGVLRADRSGNVALELVVDAGFQLITRDGNDFTSRFLLAAAAVSALPARSFLIDGEAIVTNGNGLAVFDPIRRKRNGGAAVLIAFDLIKVMSHSITVLA
jgi:ATP-dependent DNA ligase